MSIETNATAVSTDPQPTIGFSGFTDLLAAEAARRTGIQAEIAPAKAAIFAALSAAGVVRVRASYDGCGDSGQFEEFVAEGLDETEHPLDEVAATVVVDPAEPDGVPIAEVVETLCYDLLELFHNGYENNDGGYGEFVFEVATGTVTLIHNDRYTAVDTTEQEF